MKMEYYWALFKNSTGNSSSGNGFQGHNGNCTTHAWESSSDMFGSDNRAAECFTYPHHSPGSFPPDGEGEASAFHAPVSAGHELRVPTDPHLTCLKLGKRQYFEGAASPTATKKGKAWCGGSPVPLCQVEGCGSALANAKDYHRRHKVCEMHAKAPRVVLVGIDQRFCQQCSRFHAVGEFDESKRSCRRRLAGHNQRRRKSSQEHHHSQGKSLAPPLNSPGQHALSLLSSTATANCHPVWHSSDGDLPARCRAALRELIAENRASSLALRQHMNNSNLVDHNANNYCTSYRNWGSIRAGPMGGVGGHVTLDLMQDPGSAFGLLFEHNRGPASRGGNDDGDCSELWNVPMGY